MIPPAAARGRATAERTAAASSAVVAGTGEPAAAAPGRKAALWPPAQPCCTTSASTPCSAACLASVVVVTVASTADPARCRARTMSGPGSPKVKLTSSTGSASRASILPCQSSSSSSRGGVSSTPYRRASAAQFLPVFLQLRQHGRRRRQLGAVRDEHVHAEPGAGVPGGADFRLHPGNPLVARGQEADAACRSARLSRERGVEVPPAIGAAMIRVPKMSCDIARSCRSFSSLVR